MRRGGVKVDIPCEVQQIDDTGYVWAFLHESRDPGRIAPGAIVVAADEEDPVLARVVSLTERPNGIKVHLEILPGDPLEYAEALRRAQLLPASAGVPLAGVLPRRRTVR